MNLFLVIFLMLSTFGVIYWIIWGQRKQQLLLNPPRKTELKAILFDMDGTIVDTFDQWHKILNEAGLKYGRKPITKAWFRKHIWGGSMENDAKKYFKTKDVEKIAHEYSALKKKYICDQKLMEGADDVLKKLREMGYKIALVTNTSKAPTKEALTCYNLDGFFDAIVTADDISERKPSPEPLWKACEKLDVMFDEVLYVGDTPIDRKAARRAGIVMVGLNTKGDFMISSLRDLLALVSDKKEKA
jgi:HAD superfamily hydrolase (TIGR01549 family)